ncbi:leucine-rich melanocyte differentiation-associated protein-like [Lineus longissimus]|uniref:leucine-rich melanocyte differentiation-associated protein-like n=1 Tax=Lineus longissimus TaxID=88925 RepID=UPI002B4E58E7
MKMNLADMVDSQADNGDNNGMAEPVACVVAEEDLIFRDGQLTCIGKDLTRIPDELSCYSQATTRLDLSFNTLRSLEGLEAFTKLEELILDNNDLGDSVIFPVMKNLHTLMLNKNRIVSLDNLVDKIQASLPSLTYLSLLGNIACPNQLSSFDKDEEDYQRYRVYLLHRLPKLKFIDSTPVKNDERKEAIQKGHFMKVVRPADDMVEEDRSLPHQSSSPYTPLPNSDAKNPRQPVGTFGTCKYVYYGKHSEGNRFIRNNDL